MKAKRVTAETRAKLEALEASDLDPRSGEAARRPLLARPRPGRRSTRRSSTPRAAARCSFSPPVATRTASSSSTPWRRNASRPSSTHPSTAPLLQRRSRNSPPRTCRPSQPASRLCARTGSGLALVRAGPACGRNRRRIAGSATLAPRRLETGSAAPADRTVGRRGASSPRPAAGAAGRSSRTRRPTRRTSAARASTSGSAGVRVVVAAGLFSCSALVDPGAPRAAVLAGGAPAGVPRVTCSGRAGPSLTTTAGSSPARPDTSLIDADAPPSAPATSTAAGVPVRRAPGDRPARESRRDEQEALVADCPRRIPAPFAPPSLSPARPGAHELPPGA